MGLNIVELFGYGSKDSSKHAQIVRKSFDCPFLNSRCTKQLRDGTPSGACTVRQKEGPPVICCPNRLYWDDYAVLQDIAREAFGRNAGLLPKSRIAEAATAQAPVAVFGKRWGKELHLPKKGGHGNFFVDWVLVLLDSKGAPKEFVAVEVQSIDTTGNYQAERLSILSQKPFAGMSKAGLNWENVNKRILPQLIYKGHVLRREEICTKGLFFVCPAPVYAKINARLGSALPPYPQDRGTITFCWYDLGPEVKDGHIRSLVKGGSFTTTIDQLTLALDRAMDLPEAGVYEKAIKEALGR
jgi:hypothetical protein